MARLIDADKLRHELIMGHDLVGAKYVDMADTVEAITIDWIEDWLDKITDTRDGEDISQLPEQLKFAIQMINRMEMDWRKENDKESKESH